MIFAGQRGGHAYHAVDVEDYGRDLHFNEDANNASARKSSRIKWFVGSLCMGLVMMVASTLYHSQTPQLPDITQNLVSENKDAEFDDRNRFILKNFDNARPMSNFLNGIGGLWGVPMWAFYVNRGQGISSFGKQNKDMSIAKFVTAEKAYQQTAFTGFRTFIRGEKAGKSFEHMPFFPVPVGSEKAKTVQRNMMIGANEMEIEEVETSLGLKTNILYFIAPNQDFPALVRTTTFTNLDTKNEMTIDVLDGLARLLPNGVGNGPIDAMGRTLEAWMNVYNVGAASSTGAKITQPFFHISQDTADTALVRMIKDGFFAVAYLEGDDSLTVQPDNTRPLLPFIVDPSVVFERDTSMTTPSGFYNAASLRELVEGPQGTTSRTPCAFAGATYTLAPGKSIKITSVYGYAENLETLVGKYSVYVSKPDYTTIKRETAQTIVDDITKKVDTATSSLLFDLYVKQDFLDNVLRGGLPIQIGLPGATKNFHVYSRIHGDIERDYNYFQIDTSYFSQGPGNFRDVAQNRRLDSFHSPDTKDFNIKMFLSFVQADGYNPLTVASTLFKIPPESMDTLLKSLHIVDLANNGGQEQIVRGILGRPFRPGQFFHDIDAVGVKFSSSKEEVLATLVSAAKQEYVGQFSQNGYWSDHWTYTLDLMDSFVSIYPDMEESFLWQAPSIPFFFSPAVVRPRIMRYSLVDNPSKPQTAIVRSYNAISTPADPDYNRQRIDMMNAMYGDPGFIIDTQGAGDFWQRASDYSVFKVSPIAKFFMLGVIKYSTLDPMGMGVEMEGGKPGWNDAMNGLPGILGSGMPETYEMLRILRYVKGAVSRFKHAIEVPSEFVEFVNSLEAAVDEYLASDKSDAAEFKYWDASNHAREWYRSKVATTFAGSKTALLADQVVRMLQKFENRVAIGVKKALGTTATGLTPTYFYYDCTEFDMVPVDSSTTIPTKVKPRSFKTRTLPLFLEGPTRQLKVVDDIEERRSIYKLVRNSPLYDAALKMYTLCESLATMGQDIGRMKAFSPGWLENQSVWLHMSYKFYLELLRGGLYEEFFEEISTGLVPFMDHEIYGRSPLEAASFIVSSAFPDRKLHGTSFLARLSGSTAELLSMWAFMMAGPRPFGYGEDGQLKLQFSPVIPSWLFTDAGTVSFTFLGEVKVTYLNPNKIDTWKISPQSIRLIDADDGTEINIDGPVISGVLAAKVRDRKIKSIVVQF